MVIDHTAKAVAVAMVDSIRYVLPSYNITSLLTLVNSIRSLDVVVIRIIYSNIKANAAIGSPSGFYI